MNHILQNVKSGFANMKELVGIFLNVDENSDGYDRYINGNDIELSQIAGELKCIEQQQESKRFSLLSDKQPKRSTRSTKKNFKSSPSAKGKSSHKKISNDEHIREGIEPEI